MRILSVLMLAVFIFSCNNESKSVDTDNTKQAAVSSTGQPVFDKLVGTWKMKDGKNFERWTKLDNGNYASVAFSVKGTDTSWNEQASIYPENGKWVFENNVRDQNDNKAVKFTSSFIDANSVNFNNPEHDFPTDVHYTVADANTVNAFIAGPNPKGGKDTIPFNYTRIN